MATKQGALAKDPSKAAGTKQAAKTAPGLSRLSPGIYRNSEGQLTNARGQRIDSRGRRIKAGGGAAASRGEGTPNAPRGSAEEAFRRMNPEQQEREVYEDAGSYYNQMMSNAMRFDPNNPAAGYQQAFTNQMDAARQTVMDQFERSMAPQFQREQADFQQRMAEQGIDPNSKSYEAQYRAMMDAQNNQRLNAQAQAFQLGGQYQQQGFEQAIQGQMMPAQFWQATGDVWNRQYQTRQDAIQKERDRQAALRQASIGAGASVRSAQISADANRYAADLNALSQGYGQGSQGPDWRNEAIRGVVAGGTAAVLK